MTGKKAPEFGSTMVVWKMNNENELYNTIMFQLRKKYRYCVVRDIMDQSCAVLNWQWGPKSSLKGNKIKNWTADQTYDGAVKNKLGKDSQEPWSTLVGSFWPDFFVHTQGVGKPWNQLISDTLWKNPNASIEYHINKMYRTCPRLKPEQIRWRSVHAHLLWGPYRELWQALNPQYAIENVAVAIGEKDGKIEKIENFENVTIPKEHFKTHPIRWSYKFPGAWRLAMLRGPWPLETANSIDKSQIDLRVEMWEQFGFYGGYVFILYILYM